MRSSVKGGEDVGRRENFKGIKDAGSLRLGMNP